MAPASGLGITTTLRLPAGGEKPLLSWVRWHLGLGFDHAFLFFDEPRPHGADDAWAPVGAREVRARWAPERVTVVHRTAEQRAWQRARCSAWAEFGPHADDEVQARQVLNAEQAMALALAPERALRWLVHLDIDELFYVEPPAGEDERAAGGEGGRAAPPRVPLGLR